jgi:regulator of cell morphogenesis and NO signaling
MQIHERMTLSEVVLRAPLCAKVFDQFRLDYCCGGRISISEACAQRGLDTRAVVDALGQAVPSAWPMGRPSPVPGIHDPQAATPTLASSASGEFQGEEISRLTTHALIAHIVEHYHAGLRRDLPSALAHAEKVGRVHGPQHEEMRELDRVVRGLSVRLLEHLDAEEKELFPALLAAEQVDTAARIALWGEIAQMVTEHHEIAEALGCIRELTSDFAPPKWACATVRVLFRELEHLDGEIRRHVHLENHALAPRFGL